MTQDIHIDIQGHIMTLTMARPKRRNALTLAMYEAMTEALDLAKAQEEIRAVCFKGAEGAFTSGNDLMDFMKSPPTGQDSPVFCFLRALVDFPKPLVAAVQGYAVGIGTTMLLHCDLVYADTTALFQMPFVNLALVPEAASSLLLPQTVGHQRASELLLLGERFDAATALRYGMLNDVYETDQFDQKVQERLETLASKPPTSVVLSKKLIKDRGRAQIDAVMLEEAAYFVERLASPEFMAVVQSFLAKRG